MIKAILVGVIVGLILMATGYGQTPTRADLLKTIQHIESLAKETQAELDQEKAAHAQTQQALGTATLNLTTTKNEFDTYKKGVDDIVKKANEAIAAHDSLVKHLHRAKWIATGLVLAACGLLVLKIGGKIGLILGGIAAPSLIAFIWAWL